MSKNKLWNRVVLSSSNYLLILLVFFSSFSYSQTDKTNNSDLYLTANPIVKKLLDSLNVAKNDAERVRLFNSLSWNLADVNFEAGKNFGDSAFALANKLGLDVEKATALNNIGEILSISGNTKEAISKHLQALQIFNSINNKSGIANTYKLLGFSFYNISDFKSALEYLNSALETYENINDESGAAIIHNHLGNVYGTIKDLDNALNHFNKSLSFVQSVGDSSRAAVNLGNIGLIYFEKKKYKKAIENYLTALKVFKALNQEMNYSVYLGNAGLAYLELKEFSKAQKFFNEALSISKKLKDGYGIAFENANLGKMNYILALQNNISETQKLDHFRESITYYNNAISILEPLGLANDQKNYLFELSTVYKSMGNYKLALEAYVKASALKDSVLSESTKKAIAELETKQQLKEKDKELEILNNEKEYQTKVTRSLFIILFLLAIIIVLIIYASRKQKKINDELQKNIIKREETEKILRLNEAELKKHRDQLENLVEERTKELKAENSERLRAEKEALAAKEKAENSDKLKSEFLAQMSHEIRTPLNIINGFNTILKDELQDNATPVFKKAMSNLEAASNRIIRTVDMVLKMSEVTLGTAKVSFSKFDFKETILDELLDKYSYLAKEKNLYMECVYETDKTIVYSDDYYVFQIFVNLIDNAIKYTPSGGIKIIIRRNDFNELSVSVIDSGIGISHDFFPNMFQSFSQEERGYTRSYEGNGLGLSLVSNYCKLIGAIISVESEKGKGSSFTVTFPLNSVEKKLST
jgi:signal transduction histidine kinase